MTHYDSTARVPFAKGGSVKDKVKKGLKIASYAFPQTWGIAAGEQAKKVAKKFRDKKYKGKVHSTAEGRRAATKRTIKRGAKKVFDKSGLNLKKGFEGYKRLGSKIAKKFRDKKKIEHN